MLANAAPLPVGVDVADGPLVFDILVVDRAWFAGSGVENCVPGCGV